MNNYLFIILDRYESSFSKTIPFKSEMTPKKAFKFAVLENCAEGEGDPESENWYKDEFEYEICQRGNLVTHDGEEKSYILIKLDN